MKKYMVLLFGCFFMTLVHAQELTVGKLNQEWRMYYQKGCENLENAKYERAENSIKKSLELLKKNGAENTNSYIYSLLKLAEIYYDCRNNEKLKVLEAQILLMGEIINRNYSAPPGHE